MFDSPLIPASQAPIPVQGRGIVFLRDDGTPCVRLHDGTIKSMQGAPGAPGASASPVYDLTGLSFGSAGAGVVQSFGQWSRINAGDWVSVNLLVAVAANALSNQGADDAVILNLPFWFLRRFGAAGALAYQAAAGREVCLIQGEPASNQLSIWSYSGTKFQWASVGQWDINVQFTARVVFDDPNGPQ